MPSLVKMKLKSGKDNWTVRYRINGKQKTYTIGQCDKRTAQKVFNEVSAMLADGKSLEEQSLEGKLLQDFFDEYMARTQHVKAASTLTREKNIFRNFLNIVGNIPLSAIKPLTMEEYRQNRLDSGLAPATVNIEFRHLEVAFNAAKRWELIDANPLENVRYIRVPQSEFPRFLSIDEINRTIEAFRGSNFEPIVKFYLATGARLAEALSLTWKDIDFSRGQVVISGVNAKGKRNRVISLKYSPGTLDMLRRLKRRRDGKVFGPFTKRGKELPQWRSDWVGRHISNVLTSIGLPWATCHTFRHTFASHLVMAGVPIFTVQRLLGHAQIDTTMIYAHLAEDHSAEMMAKLPY